VSDLPILGYSIPDTCKALSLGKTTVYMLIGQGKLRARAVGGRTIVEAQSVREFFESCPPAAIGQKQQAA